MKNSPHITGRIAFEDVSFHYPDAEENSLNHLTFTVEPGRPPLYRQHGQRKIDDLLCDSPVLRVTGGKLRWTASISGSFLEKKLRDSLDLCAAEGVLFSGTIQSNLKFGGDKSLMKI